MHWIYLDRYNTVIDTLNLHVYEDQELPQAELGNLEEQLSETWHRRRRMSYDGEVSI